MACGTVWQRRLKRRRPRRRRAAAWIRKRSIIRDRGRLPGKAAESGSALPPGRVGHSRSRFALRCSACQPARPDKASHERRRFDDGCPEPYPRVDLTRVLVRCAQTLADFGADVIKVERPGAGDDTPLGAAVPEGRGRRGYRRGRVLPRGEPQQALGDGRHRDARRPADRARAAQSDVVLENYKVGQLKKYADRLRFAARGEARPRLLLGHRVRPDWPGSAPRGLRLHHPGSAAS